MKNGAPVRRLLYVGQTPSQGTGSPVIVWRHLRRMAAEGWAISIVAEQGQASAACAEAGWSVLSLPLRRPWWPPYRSTSPEWLRRLRMKLLAREVRRQLPAQPDAVLGYLAAHDDFPAELAAACATALRRPLTLLIHDDASSFESSTDRRARDRRLLASARTNWFVTPALASASPAPLNRRQILLPLPEGWSGKPASPPPAGLPMRLYYAGHLWPAQVPLLARLARALALCGARLVIMTRLGPALQDLAAAAPIEHQPPFADNHAALAHLAAHATAVIVCYAETVTAMPLSATSFPSKFAEYCHLGLPAVLVAPRATALGSWAAENAFADFFDPSDSAALDSAFAAWALGLRDPAVWSARAAVSLRLASNEFSPDRIHRAFADALLS